MSQPGVSFAPSRAAGSFVDQFKARVVLLAVFVGSIWATFFLSVSMPFLHLNRHGVVPRTLSGLQGILFAPWLHAGLWHITANTGGLLVLLMGLSTALLRGVYSRCLVHNEKQSSPF